MEVVKGSRYREEIVLINFSWVEVRVGGRGMVWLSTMWDVVEINVSWPREYEESMW